MKCDKCLKRIGESEAYYELQEWEMQNGDGSEVGDTRLCQGCYSDMKKFLLPQ